MHRRVASFRDLFFPAIIFRGAFVIIPPHLGKRRVSLLILDRDSWSNLELYYLSELAWVVTAESANEMARGPVLKTVLIKLV
jgi:hypothetical protein